MQTVHCSDCGYLARRYHQTQELHECDHAFRKSASVPFVPLGPGQVPDPRSRPYLYDFAPVCFPRAANLEKECYELLKPEQHHDAEMLRSAILKVIAKDRECVKWTAWDQGYSPKHHRDREHAMELKQAEEKGREQERCRRLEEKWADRKWQLVLLGIGALLTIMGGLISRFLGPPAPNIIIQQPTNISGK